jgi:hypothetical protein
LLATKPTTLAGLQAFLEYVGKWQSQDDGIYADAGDLLTAIRSAAESAKTLAFAAASRQLATGGRDENTYRGPITSDSADSDDSADSADADSKSSRD